MNRSERKQLAISTAKRTLVAFFFGFVISGIFALAMVARFEPLVKLERESVDFGLRLANAVFGDSADSVALPQNADTIVMVDIDRDACAMLASANRCGYDRIIQSEVLEAVVETVEAVNPSVAVLDMLVTPEEGAALATAMGTTGPPLLTAMELSELDEKSGRNVTGYILTKSLCGAVKCGRLEYLPAQALVQDGKARYYPRYVDVAILNDLEGRPKSAKPFPTIAFRAAALATGEEPWNDGSIAPAIGYTIPSFVFAGNGTAIDPRQRRNRKLVYKGNVEQYWLSSIKESSEAKIEIGGLSQQPILIIGSSAASGGDIHNTPLGPMGGMEVVANAIRSFQLAEPEQIPSIGKAFFTKIEAVIKALIIIAIVECFLAYYSMRREKMTNAGCSAVGEGAFWDKWSAPILLTMLLAFLGETLLTMWEIISQLNADAGRAAAVDVIWPVVGVTISAIVGFASEIIAKIEWFVEWMFDVAGEKKSAKTTVGVADNS